MVLSSMIGWILSNFAFLHKNAPFLPRLPIFPLFGHWDLLLNQVIDLPFSSLLVYWCLPFFAFFFFFLSLLFFSFSVHSFAFPTTMYDYGVPCSTLGPALPGPP
jgi:hypothetical protein